MIIRESNKEDVIEIEKIHSLAFGEKEGPVIVKLVHDLFKDITAKPLFSIVAEDAEEIIGHILFTKVEINESKILAQILAPLAVLPDYQGKGIGRILIKEGIKKLKMNEVGLVFVLGYPEYYSRFGFIQDAKKYGFATPFPIEDKNKNAWMVQELKSGLVGKVNGKVKCAKTLNKKEYWQE